MRIRLWFDNYSFQQGLTPGLALNVLYSDPFFWYLYRKLYSYFYTFYRIHQKV